MPTAPGPPTVYLGQFTWAHANAIAERLEQAGIVWWHKQAGPFVRFFFAGDWGVRLFVEKTRLEEARQLAESVAEPD
jgi:hypothetical protein